MTRTRAAVPTLVALALAAVAALVTLLAPRTDAPPLEQHVRDFTGQLSPRGPYRPPAPAERDAVLGAVASLLDPGADAGPAQQALEDAGFTVGGAPVSDSTGVPGPTSAIALARRGRPGPASLVASSG